MVFSWDKYFPSSHTFLVAGTSPSLSWLSIHGHPAQQTEWRFVLLPGFLRPHSGARDWESVSGRSLIISLWGLTQLFWLEASDWLASSEVEDGM